MAQEWREIDVLRAEVTQLREVVVQWTEAAEQTEKVLERHECALKTLAELVGRHLGKLEAHMKLEQANGDRMRELIVQLMDEEGQDRRTVASGRSA